LQLADPEIEAAGLAEDVAQVVGPSENGRSKLSQWVGRIQRGLPIALSRRLV
jgi:hypothetical protein